MGKRLPAILGIFFILISAVIGVMFVSRETDFLPRARPEYIPQKVKLTNLTDTGFTVSWITAEPAIGFVKLGTAANNLNITVTDDRDQLTGDSGEFKSHYITIQNLQSATAYYFKIGSQGKQLYDNEGSAFTITTAPVLPPNTAVDTAYGTVLTPAQTPGAGAIVYVSLPEAAPLSALVKPDGKWAVTLSNARTLDLKQFALYDPQTSTLNLMVRDVNGETTQIITTTATDQPAAPIILGQSTTAPAINPSAPLPESKFSLKPIEVTEPKNDQTIAITEPSRDGLTLATLQPQIKGIAPKNTIVTITLESTPIYTQTVTTNSQGFWNWTSPGILSVGTHSLRASYNDAEGILHAVRRTFTLKDGNTLTYSATPSASLAPTKSVVTPSVKVSPTVRPTASNASPTLAPTRLPTKIPTLVPTLPPQELPPAGTTQPSLLLAGIGLGALVIGFLLLNQRFIH